MNILLVEDSRTNQILAEALLDGAGHNVTLANNGVEAVQAAAAQTFDVILMDLQMPEMDGFEAAQKIREREASSNQHTPIVALSATPHGWRCSVEQNSGMDGCMTKPIVLEVLDELLNGLGQGD